MSTLYQSELGGRPFPLDRERRRRVMIALAGRDLNITTLSKALNLPRSYVSEVISGRDLSPKIEQRIADFLGKSTDDLFPDRTPDEIKKMRRAEASQQAASRQAAARKGTAA